MAAASPGQDKPLCPCTRPRGQRIPPRLGLIFRESRYHILLLAPLPFGPFGLSLIFCSLTFRPPPPPPPSIVRRWEGGIEPLVSWRFALDEYPTLIVAAALYRRTYYVHIAEYIMQISYLRGWFSGEGRKFLIFSLFGRKESEKDEFLNWIIGLLATWLRFGRISKIWRDLEYRIGKKKKLIHA